MKHTATGWKQKGAYRKHNLGQYPIFLEANNQSNDFSHSGKSPPRTVPFNCTRARISTNCLASSPAIPISYPELVVAKRLSLLLHLTPLTWPRLGMVQFAECSASSTLPLSTQHFGSRKLLSFLPSRYGHVPALSHATDCVLAKLQQIMLPPDNRSAGGQAKILMHYSKALRALQVALNDESQRTTAETLCAMELLGFFEVRTYKLMSTSPSNH
jgi:hypothetical protein